MDDTVKRVSPGDVITADTHNDIADAVNRLNRVMSPGQSEGISTGAHHALRYQRPKPFTVAKILGGSNPYA